MELWACERARAREVHVEEKTSLLWARTDDDRKDWARTALLEAGSGDRKPFVYWDETRGEWRNVRVAVLIPDNIGKGSKDALLNDDKFREQINELYRAGAVVVRDNQRDPSDLFLVSEAVDLRGIPLRCFGLAELQERGLVVLWEPFAAEALAASTAVFGQDEASVKLRKKHAIYWRTPKTGRQKPGGPDPEDVVDGIPRVALGSTNSFRVHPDVLEASDQREAERRKARGLGRRRR